MAGISLALYTAEQSLLNTQTELATSSNNISNANTPGYARETAVQTENPQTWTTPGWMGTGASITNIAQARDNFLEQQLMNATTGDSQYTSLASQLATVQTTASDSGANGISQALGNFFDAWSSLAQNPANSSEQSQVYSTAQNLASSIQSTQSQLGSMGGQITSQVADTVTQANSLINQIAQLNKSVQCASPLSQPNTLIDQRYAAMDSLSKLIPVTFANNTDGTVDVSTIENGSAVNLVSGQTVAAQISSTSAIGGGQFGGLLQAQNNLNSYMTQFDNFADTLSGEVDSVSTLPVFSGTSASTITANSGFLSGKSSSQLAAIAQNMSGLQDTAVSFPDGGSSTLQQYLGAIQQTIGTDTQQANSEQSFYDSLKSQLQAQQQSVSGVSLDEEMVNVIQFQQIYQAAAKVITTTSSLLSTAINMVQ